MRVNVELELLGIDGWIIEKLNKKGWVSEIIDSIFVFGDYYVKVFFVGKVKIKYDLGLIVNLVIDDYLNFK